MTTNEKGLFRVGLVIITGGSSGIGNSFINTIGKVNPKIRIFNLSRRPPKRVDGAQQVIHYNCDLSTATERKTVFTTLVSDIENTFFDGEILLINNAGFGAYGPFPEGEYDNLTEMVAVNVAAPIELASVLLPALRKRGGTIINVASVAAFQPTPGMAVYGATKAFLLNWSLALREELRGTGVNVIALCPGATGTPFHERAGLGSEPVGGVMSESPDAVVRTALRAVSRNRSYAVSGRANRIAAMLAGFLPKAFVARVAGRIISRLRLRT